MNVKQGLRRISSRHLGNIRQRWNRHPFFQQALCLSAMSKNRPENLAISSSSKSAALSLMLSRQCSSSCFV